MTKTASLVLAALLLGSCTTARSKPPASQALYDEIARMDGVMFDGKDDCGVFKFLHVWKKTDGTWKVTRAFSYDH